MLKVYVDDSGIGQPPAYFLGGWLAPASTWLAFSQDWDAVLRMSPRIRYFSLNEAMNDLGEFHGMSEPSRNEKLRTLAHVIADHHLTSVSAMIPHELFQGVFADSRSDPFMNREKLFRNPYYFLFFGLISQIYKFQIAHGVSEKIEFIFDQQFGQEEIVKPIFAKFMIASPPECKAMLSRTPHFSNDKDVLPLQAADFCAGGFYRNAKDFVAGNDRSQIWSGIIDHLDRIDWVMTVQVAIKILQATIPVPNRLMNASLDSVWHAMLAE